jgi:hypothetical protein
MGTLHTKRYLATSTEDIDSVVTRPLAHHILKATEKGHFRVVPSTRQAPLPLHAPLIKVCAIDERITILL